MAGVEIRYVIGTDSYQLINRTKTHILNLPSNLTASINEILKDVPTFIYELKE